MKNIFWLLLVISYSASANDPLTFEQCAADPTFDKCIHINEAIERISSLESRLTSLEESGGLSAHQKTVIRGEDEWIVLEKIRLFDSRWNSNTYECRIFARMIQGSSEDLAIFPNVASEAECDEVYGRQVTEGLGFLTRQLEVEL